MEFLVIVPILLRETHNEWKDKEIFRELAFQISQRDVFYRNCWALDEEVSWRSSIMSFLSSIPVPCWSTLFLGESANGTGPQWTWHLVVRMWVNPVQSIVCGRCMLRDSIFPRDAKQTSRFTVEGSRPKISQHSIGRSQGSQTLTSDIGFSSKTIWDSVQFQNVR